MKPIAVYVRVSSKQQDQRSQEPDLKRWVQGQDAEVVWYRDHFTGRTMERPGMNKLMAEVTAGRVGTVVVWRLSGAPKSWHARSLKCFQENDLIGHGLPTEGKTDVRQFPTIRPRAPERRGARPDPSSQAHTRP